MPWLTPMGEDTLVLDYDLNGSANAASGALREQWTRYGRGGAVLTRVPSGEPVVASDPEPAPDPTTWLFPPCVLAKLYAEPLLTGLTGGPAVTWPRVDLVDPGWDGGTDVEGTSRTPVRFTESGELRLYAVDRRAAALRGQPLTGHGGLSGPVVRDLVVGPDAAGHPLPAAATIVRDAECVASDQGGRNALIAVRLFSDVQDKFGVLLPRLCDLLDAGRWCGPWQRGSGAWTSRWLTLERGALRWLAPRPL